MTLKNTDNFRISVTNTQLIDGSPESVCESGRGSFREKNGIYYIVYRTESSSNMIKTDGSFVNVKRTGDASSDMRYELGKHTSFKYNTPYGSIDMSIFTKKISCALESGGGIIKLEYVLKTGGDKLYNDMTIRIER